MKKTFLYSKMVIIAIIVTILLFAINLQAQEKYSNYISAGYSLSNIDSSTNIIQDKSGYYLSFGSIGQINEFLEFGMEVQYNEQNEKSGLNKIKSNSIASCFIFRVSPMKNNFMIMTGPRIGYDITHRSIQEDNRNLTRAQFGWMFGAGYSIKRFTIEAKYNRTLNNQLIKSFIQVGLAYRVNK